MTRRFVFIAVALALMVGLYFYDRDNSTRTVIATTVLSFEDQDNEAGPDTWHVTVDVLGEPTALEPLQTRPNIAVGDTLCVTRISRAGQPDEFRRANASDSC
jgi:hypothetical protein